MQSVLAVRDAIRDFIRKFDEITAPLLRFIFSFIMFKSIQELYGYSDLFDRGIVIFLLALISALASDVVAVLLGGLVLIVNSMAVSMDVGLLHILLFVLMYCTYVRMFPNCAWIMAFVPVMFMWKIYFVIPIIIVIFAGPTGIVPTAFGTLIYYVSRLVRDIKLGDMTADKDFQAYNYIVENISKNKSIMTLLIIFAVVIMITSILYRLPYDYAFYVAIAIGGVLNILVTLLVDGATTAGISMGKVVSGSFLGIFLGLIIQLCKSILDYAHKEVVQFEDDEYYYYVKAIPNFTSKRKPELPKPREAMKQAMAVHSRDAKRKELEAELSDEPKAVVEKQPRQTKQAKTMSGEQQPRQTKQAKTMSGEQQPRQTKHARTMSDEQQLRQAQQQQKYAQQMQQPHMQTQMGQHAYAQQMQQQYAQQQIGNPLAGVKPKQHGDSNDEV